MNRKWLAAGLIAVILLVFSSSSAQAPVQDNQVAFMQEIQKINLPDGRGWYTMVISNGDTVLDQWFESDPRLVNLKKSTAWRKYRADSPVLTEKHHKAYGSDFPLLILQDESGAVRAQITGTVIRSLQDSEDLVTLLDIASDQLRPADEKLYEKVVWRHWGRPNVCPGPYCPQPKPEPKPEPQPFFNVAPVDTPTVETPWLDAWIKRLASSAISAVFTGNPAVGGAMAGGVALLLLLRHRRKNKGR